MDVAAISSHVDVQNTGRAQGFELPNIVCGRGRGQATIFGRRVWDFGLKMIGGPLIQATITKVMEGNTRSLDYNSCEVSGSCQLSAALHCANPSILMLVIFDPHVGDN